MRLQSTRVPTRRQRAVSAAVVAPPLHRCTRTGHCSRSRCFGRRDGDCWKSRHSTSASPTIPMPEEAILGCSRGRNRTIAVVPHRRAAAGGFPGAIQQPPAPYMYSACTAQRACSLLATQSAQIGRQRPLRARVASEPIRTCVYRPNAQGLMDVLAHTTGSYPYATRASVKLQRRVSFASCASLPCDCRSCEVECEG